MKKLFLIIVSSGLLAFTTLTITYAQSAPLKLAGSIQKADDGPATGPEQPIPQPTTPHFPTKDDGPPADSFKPEPKAPEVEAPPAKPLRPKLNIDIPTVHFSLPENLQSDGKKFSIPYIGEYIAGVFQYAVGIIAFIAVMTLIVAGMLWATAGGNSSRIAQAKEMIERSIIGLFIILGSYTILNVIDPNLTTLNNVNLVEVQTENFAPLQDVPPPPGAPVITNEDTTAGVGVDVTGLLSPCPSDTAYAKEHPETIKPCVPCDLVGTSNNPFVKVPKSQGLKLGGNLYTSPAVADGLSKAGAIAAQSGYTIYVGSTCRTYKGQLTIWTPQGQKKGIVAKPGSSNHGTGMAVDVKLMKDGSELTTMKASKQCSQDPTALKTLTDIMFAAGFHRYMPEIWHYEIGTKIDGKYRQKSAALPSSCK